MSNYFSNGVMRRMRQYTKAVEDNLHSKDKDMKHLADLRAQDEITQTVYDREAAGIKNQIFEQRKALVEAVKKDLTATFQEMRKIASEQIVKSPTPEMVSTLQILAMLDKITPTQLTLYAEQMSECPLAMQRLQQIAATHDQRIYIDDPESRLRALDALEGNLVNYLTSFDGDENQCPYSVRNMYRYFRPDECYMGSKDTPLETDKVNSMFWNEFVGVASYDVFDNPTGAQGKPKVQYFFGDLDGLTEFIKKCTVGVKGSLVDDVVSMILADCPEQYGAAYRHYKATGEKIDINGQSSDDESEV